VTIKYTREQAVERYGHIDFASKHWPKESEWIKLAVIPTDWFKHWTVLDTDLPVRVIACNADIKVPLMTALFNVKEQGLGDLLQTFDGCYNVRMVRGSNTLFSAHSYGLAFDLNASANPLGMTQHGFYDHLDLVKCFTDQGFHWGGNWSGRKDPMHFSFAGWE
jgi:hypothetical protein